MPIRPESASAAARAEAELWADVADTLAGTGLDGQWFERVVIPQVDPRDDLERRTRKWSHRLPGDGLPDLCRFAAGLAAAEATGWETDDAVVATRAHEDRRFLLADRMIHWAVPLLLAARLDAAAESVLEVGDAMRLAPVETAGEGLSLPGHDVYGPADEPVAMAERPTTLWGGWLWIGEDKPTARGYEQAAKRWQTLAAAHPGTAALWLALARRATSSAHALS